MLIRLFLSLILCFSFLLNAQVPRKVLHESFTGSSCSPCAPTADTISSLLHNNEGKYTVIKYQLGGDPYNTAEGTTRINFYQGGGGYSIPYLAVDGEHFKPNDVNMDNTYGDYYHQAMFDQKFSDPSYIKMNLSNFNVSNQTVSLDIELIMQEALSGIPKLHVAVIENKTYLNTGTNGQTEFHYVMKKMLPDQNGTSLINVQANDTLNYNFIYTFQGDYCDSTNFTNPVNHAIQHTVENFNNLSIVAFVQGIGKEVFQSEWSLNATSNINNDNLLNRHFKLYPNPTKDILHFDYFLNSTENVSIYIYDMLGKTVFMKALGSQIPGSYNTKVSKASNLNGQFIVELRVGNKSLRRKAFIKP